MIELIVLACLISAPDQCRHTRISYREGTTQGCLVASQGELAQWALAHPKHKIIRITCRKALDAA